MPNPPQPELLDLKYNNGGLTQVPDECQIIRIKGKYAHLPLKNGQNLILAGENTVTYTLPGSPYSSQTIAITLAMDTSITLEEISEPVVAAEKTLAPTAVAIERSADEKALEAPLLGTDSGDACSLASCFSLLCCCSIQLALSIPVCIASCFPCLTGKRKFNEAAFNAELKKIAKLHTNLKQIEIVYIVDAIKQVHDNFIPTCGSIQSTESILEANRRQFTRDTTLAGKEIGDDYGHGGEGGTGPIYYDKYKMQSHLAFAIKDMRDQPDKARIIESILDAYTESHKHLNLHTFTDVSPVAAEVGAYCRPC